MHADSSRDPHDLGLAHDLAVWQQQMLGRRRALRWLLGAGAAGVVGCGGGGDDSASDTAAASSSGSSGAAASGSCTVIPEETAGPYPGDGSNTSGGSVANALLLSGIARSDIRNSIAGASGVAEGVPLTVVLELVNTNGGCADLAGYAIYLWHCDREGRYSMYSSGVTAENYLRGVQATASDGTVTFQTVFPGCYSGRWPHIHFEIYRSAGSASAWTNKLRTSQLALPGDVCSTVYSGASGYSASVTNLSRISLASDGIFSDGVSAQLASVSGNLSSGYVARLQVGIAA
ncbi:MAG TPA: intradiol ring-cleavage dioxygenase [Burkholderiaceae bacterium]|nr:intradiol ring-cleavage dioxygenase [Burkholderiaceae bacterium]